MTAVGWQRPAIAYHYACPLTCELPTPVAATQEPVETEAVVEATETVTPALEVVKEVVEQILNPVERHLSKSAITKMRKAQVIELLPQWGLKPGDYRTLGDMKKALRRVAAC